MFCKSCPRQSLRQKVKEKEELKEREQRVRVVHMLALFGVVVGVVFRCLLSLYLSLPLPLSCHCHCHCHCHCLCLCLYIFAFFCAYAFCVLSFRWIVLSLSWALYVLFRVVRCLCIFFFVVYIFRVESHMACALLLTYLSPYMAGAGGASET